MADKIRENSGGRFTETPLRPPFEHIVFVKGAGLCLRVTSASSRMPAGWSRFPTYLIIVCRSSDLEAGDDRMHTFY